jgi:DNA-binding transcriptional LysR family regulator
MRRSVPINLASVDLNLLVAFEALLAEGSVSRAGDRVGLAQSSMSNALARLRLLFNDELFVRTPRGMRPTARALRLAPPIDEALRHVRSAFADGAKFVPETDQRLFLVGVSDHADFALGVPIIALLRARAPHATLKVVVTSQENAVHMLDEGELDLVIAAYWNWPKRIRSTDLYAETFVCIARTGHPGFAKSSQSIRQFLDLPHIRVSASGGHNLFYAAVAEQNLSCRVVVTAPNFAALPYVLERTDLVAVVGERIAQCFAEERGLSVHPIPLQVEHCTIRMYWAARADHDAANIWLRERLQEIGRSLSVQSWQGTVNEVARSCFEGARSTRASSRGS